MKLGYLIISQFIYEYTSVVRLEQLYAFKSQNSLERFSIPNTLYLIINCILFTIFFTKKLYTVNRIYHKYLLEQYTQNNILLDG